VSCLAASAGGAPAHPLGVAGRAPAGPLLALALRGRGRLARVAATAGRVLAGRVQPVLAGGVAELAARVLRDGAGAGAGGAPARARPERHPPQPADLVRRAAARPLHRALPRPHAGVQVLHRQLPLQVPDDLVTFESGDEFRYACCHRCFRQERFLAGEIDGLPGSSAGVTARSGARRPRRTRSAAPCRTRRSWSPASGRSARRSSPPPQLLSATAWPVGQRSFTTQLRMEWAKGGGD
jgi:hypothetical protein